jgi:hypothetical protein
VDRGPLHPRLRDPLLGRGPGLVLAGVALLGVTLLFWKLRIIDTAVVDSVNIANADIFVGQAPMTRYAFSSLLEGRLPLWNPYQFCGAPFLAVTYVGLFYPLNWLHLWVDPAVGFELSFVLHMLLGALGMWALCRRLGMHDLAGLTAALTWIWSGFVIHWANQPQLFAALAWTPWTLWWTEGALRGSRRAAVGLAVCIAFQLLNGAMEILLHALYLAGLYTAFRVGALGRRAGLGPATRAALFALAGVLLGTLLASVQLIPTLELVARSARAPGELSFSEVAHRGRLGVWEFLGSAYSARGLSGTGVWSLVAVAFAYGERRRRLLATFCVVAAALAVGLAFGGVLFRLYYELPGVGTLFRRSYKFLDVYAFAQSLLSGLAMAQLGAWASLPRDALWRQGAWRVGLGLAIVTAAALAMVGRTQPALVAVLGLLLVFGFARGPRPRIAAMVAILGVHGLSLFFGVENRHIRPYHRPEHAAEHARESRLDWVKRQGQHQRAYISPTLWFMKQGTAQRLPIVTDYEPLAVGRYADYFDFAAGRSEPSRPFNGRLVLTAQTRWRLMDLTGTRYYVVNPWDLHLQGQIHRQIPSGGFQAIPASPRRLFERPTAMPRVWLAEEARVIEEPQAQLARLAAPDFDPRREVVLESKPEATRLPVSDSGAASPAGRARIVSYEPEQVSIEVEADRAALLVLSDLHYPGWEATLNGSPVEILRADYLFRAVGVPAGRSEVVFRYRPGSLWIGAGLSILGALAAAIWLRPAPVGSPKRVPIQA